MTSGAARTSSAAETALQGRAGPAIFETIVLAFDQFERLQPCAQCSDTRLYHRIVFVTVQQHADPPYALRLLRLRGERPCRGRAAEKPYKFAPSHGAYPKAKDHGLSIAGLGACIATKSGANVRIGSCPLITFQQHP
jgi:hypothetical protein